MIDLSLRDRPRWNNAFDKLWGVHFGSAMADSSIAPSLASSVSKVALTRQGNTFTGGSRFSNILFLVLFYYLLRLFDYPHKGYTDGAEIQDNDRDNY